MLDLKNIDVMLWRGVSLFLWRMAGPFKAYRVILAVARSIQTVARALAPGLCRRFGAPVLERLLHHALFTVSARGLIDIPVRIRNGELLRNLHALHGAVVMVSGHFGLPFAGARAVEDLGLTMAAIHAGSGRATLWGASRVRPIIDDAFALLKARTALRQGAVLGVLIDRLPGAGAHHVVDHVFRLAHRLAKPVLFFEGRLESDGAIMIEFSTPTPDARSPFLDCASLTHAFVAFISERTAASITAPHSAPA